MYPMRSSRARGLIGCAFLIGLCSAEGAAAQQSDAPVQATEIAGRPRGGVGGISSVLMAVRKKPAIRAPGMILSWKDDILPQQLAQYRILRSGSVPVTAPDPALLGIAAIGAAAALGLRRRHAFRALGCVIGAVSLAAWAAGGGVWSPPTQPIGTTRDKQFVDNNPLPDYNTYRVVAELIGQEPRRSNTGGAFVDGANGLTLELGAPLAGAGFSPDGLSLVAVSEEPGQPPQLSVLSLAPLTALPERQLSGVTVPGVLPVFHPDSSTTFVATDIGTPANPGTRLFAVSLADAGVSTSPFLPGGLVEGAALAVAPSGSRVALLLQLPGAGVRLLLAEPQSLATALVNANGQVAAGHGPSFTPDGTLLVAPLAGAANGTLLIVNVGSSSFRGQVALSGQPMDGLPVLLDAAGSVAYVPVRTSGPSDAIDQVDLATAAVRQTLALGGRLVAGAAPELLDGDGVLLVPVALDSRSDRLVAFSGLGFAPAQIAEYDLPGELPPGVSMGVSPDRQRAATVSLPAAGAAQLSLIEAQNPALASAAIAGTPVAGIGPVYSADGAAAFAFGQGAGQALLTRVTADDLSTCAASVDGTLVSGAGASLGTSSGPLLLATRQPSGDLLTTVRELPAGDVVLSTASLQSGSRATAYDTGCAQTQFLLFPGTLVPASDGPGASGASGRERRARTPRGKERPGNTPARKQPRGPAGPARR